ncbi:MAG TPA: bifunctional (p)ppGpp synthetase/guanosine-3',5'-bis(diphosphate) 3'-pyrophosphohydrolase, partial [Casimicrobiaceae bacterium]|nr:bifunctional (p)ppGpp synthetase/guanosine-3',5'-bis(diphosphate) 3'-pyrophosphohydrolase [Casimicrobiaceae bacterium]
PSTPYYHPSMVAVVHAAPGSAAPHAVAAWLDALAGSYPQADVDAFRAAFDYVAARVGEATAADGEKLADRALGIAGIVAGLKLDPASIRGALLSVLPTAKAFDADDVTARFGADVAGLVAGVARMDSIRARSIGATPEERAAQSENLRKMLLAMVEDIRVVILKLAERLQALRWLMSGDAAERRTTAREVLELYAPLANRLGVWQLKWELEDLSLRATEPDTYKEIAKLLDERRLDRQRYIEDVVATLKRELAAAHIAADVSGRPKHIFSIWTKMRRKQAGIDALYDIRAVRILVDDVKQCYTALGIVHHLWTPLPGEFDDYIAKPKANDYRSLHTAVIGPEGKPLEVQIRTREMHQHSEYGVAAHWRYKEGVLARRDPAFEDRIAWLRQVLDWKDAIADTSDWLAAFKQSLFTDTIYVLTPQGKVVDLPTGATPVDFAYAVHTSLGHRCRGAKIDGHMVPLNTPLANGQRVEVLTVKQGGPSRDWLNPDLGFVTSHRARAKVRQWFKAQVHDETVAQGRAAVERELARAGASTLNLDALAAKAGYAKPEELFAAYARDELNLRQLQMAIRAAVAPAPAPAQANDAAVVTRASKASGSGGGILIVGVDRLMTGLARCCKPAPPDPIAGFVTRGKGITIHRASCQNLARIRAREPERLIEANWGDRRDEVFPVDIVVESGDRPGLLRDISEVFSREKINVTAVNTLTKQHLARMSFTIEVGGVEQLKRALALVRDVPGVLAAGRR